MREIAAFWDRRPCNIRHSKERINSREYFEEVEKRKYFVEPHIVEFVNFPSWRGKRVLEIGCGIGTDTINFARNGALVTAVELSERSLDIARQRAKVFGLQDRIRFYFGNAEELRRFVPVETHDLIYSFGMIHHTPHPGRVIKEISFYVDQSSILKLMVYHRYSWKALWILLTYGSSQFWSRREKRGLISRYSEAQTGCPVTYLFSVQEIRQLLQRFGFRVLESKTDHIFPYQISDYRQYRYTKTWYFRWMPPSLFRWLEQRFGWHLCVTAALA